VTIAGIEVALVARHVADRRRRRPVTIAGIEVALVEIEMPPPTGGGGP
jgi:hypothetical protein